MNAQHKDFIATYTDVFPEGYCQHLISEFERLADSGAGFNRKQSDGSPKHVKEDFSVMFNIKVHQALRFNDADVADVFFSGLQECYNEYAETYSVLKNARINASAMKMQRTSPGGGYHVWHAEQNNDRQAERAVVYMLYLNTLTPEEAGETEFLYQQTRIRPQENTMIVWPAGYTHAHRGNVVHGSNYKYVATGWFYYD
jgi:hypothetical protein